MTERHAQSGELGEAVQLDASETLEGDPGDDALDSGYSPLERPSRGLRSGYADTESMDDKLSQETRPDEEWADADRSGRLVAGDDDLTATDVGIDGGAASAEEAAVHIEDEDEDE